MEKRHENKSPEYAMEVAKFMRNASFGVMHAASHGLKFPLLRFFIYTMEGQAIGSFTFAGVALEHDSIEHALSKELGGYAAGSLASGFYLLLFGTNPGVWVLLGAGLICASTAFGYAKLIDIVWKWSEDNYIFEPVYAIPDVECIEFPARFRTDWPQPQRRKGFLDLHPQRNAALPDEFFVGTPANSKNYMGITGDMGTDWLIRIK